MEKVVLIICDGLGDIPVKGKTPLQAARKPHIDALARDGECGLMHVLGTGVIPGSDTAHLQLLGYEPFLYYNGRGVFEALGAGIKLREGDVALRCNLGTVDKRMKVIDRRAGRIRTEEAARFGKSLGNITIDGVRVIFRQSVEHRGAIVLRGEDISPNITATDPHKTGPILRAMPLDKTNEAKRTARIINEFTRLSHKRLSAHPLNIKRKKEGKPVANIVLTRGASIFEKAPPMRKLYGISAACVAGGALYKGVARYIGMDVLDVKGATGTKDTDLVAKAKAAKKALRTHDFVFLHIKATDSLGHDGDFKGKTKMIEKIDKIIPLIRKTGAHIILTADHSTPVVLKRHSVHPVPILAYGKFVRPDRVSKFDERECATGGMGHIKGRELMPLIISLLGKARMFGS